MTVSVAGKEPKELMEMAASLHKQVTDHHTEHADNWTAECEAKHTELLQDVMTCKTTADRINQIGELKTARTENVENDDPQIVPGSSKSRADLRDTILMRSGRDDRGRPKYREVAVSRRGEAAYDDKFNQHLSTGSFLAGLDINTGITDGISRYATMQSDNAERAGYLTTSEQFSAGILKELDDMLWIRRRADVIQVPEASSLGIRRRTSQLKSWGWTSELQVSDKDTSLKYGKKVLTPHHATGLAQISRDLARRGGPLVTQELMQEFGRDAGELQEDSFLVGNGDQRPMGVYFAGEDGISTDRDVVTGSNTTFTPNALLDAFYHLKEGYRSGARGSLSWLFHREAILEIAKLKDSNGQYLFRVGIGFGADHDSPDARLLGIPVDESERAPNTFTAGNYGGILANWRYYKIADALDMEIQVLVENFALQNQYGYVGRMKTDGMPVLDEAFVRLKFGT